MRYLIEDYDQHGFVKSPIWLWLGWFFLAKAWVVFIAAGVSRDESSKLLEIIYPVHSTLYIGLALGLPALVLMWLMGLRSSERKVINVVVSYGKWITIVLIGMQLWLVCYQIILDNVKFSWSNASTLVLLLWFLIYIVNSRRVKDCFHFPVL